LTTVEKFRKKRLLKLRPNLSKFNALLCEFFT
jgi:hypothetical protein